MSHGSVLVLDDNEAIRSSVSMFLSDSGYATKQAADLGEALRAFDAERFDVIIADYLLPDGTAMDLLEKVKEAGASVPVILLTSHGSIDLAVRAIRAGAEHFLTKPIELPALLVVLQRLTEMQRAQRREAANRSRAGRGALDPFLGEGAAMRRLAEDAKRVAGAELPVLIQGETGSGKGVLAAWLHANGPRASEALVDLNCAGLNASFLESELFGHERGAFTGAHASKPGLLDLAHGGTLFLDEMGDLDPLVQPKLLKVLEEKRFRRLGDVRDRVVDVRLIAATHLDLQTAVASGRFRSDLYFRINALVLRVPPLRERPGDIATLARALLESRPRGSTELSDDAVRALEAYPWPGNVRELRNVLERAVLLSGRARLTAADLRLDGGATAARAPAADDPLEIVTLEENERRYLSRVLGAKNGRVDESALALGLPLSTLYQRLKRLGIGPSNG